jgi:hypothetical protein
MISVEFYPKLLGIADVGNSRKGGGCDGESHVVNDLGFFVATGSLY